MKIKMKVLRTLFAVAFAISMPLLVSCSDDDEPEVAEETKETPPSDGEDGDEPQQTQFGFSAETEVVTIGGSEDEAYVNGGSTYVIDLSEDGTVATLTINNAKFAERMPALTMQFKGIAVGFSGDNYVMSSDELIPEIADTPYPNYKITNFTGSFNATDGQLEFECAGTWKVTAEFVRPLVE